MINSFTWVKMAQQTPKNCGFFLNLLGAAKIDFQLWKNGSKLQNHGGENGGWRTEEKNNQLRECN